MHASETGTIPRTLSSALGFYFNTIGMGRGFLEDKQFKLNH